MASSRPSPPPKALRPIVEGWLAGDPDALGAWLAAIDAEPLRSVERMWWELSTTLGTVIEPPHACQGDRPLTQTLAFRPPLMTGGAPRRLIDPEQTARAWTTQTQGALSRARHREAMQATLAALVADQHPTPDAAFALLRHHTDLPVDVLAGRPMIGPPFGAPTAAVLADVRALSPVLSDRAAFDVHVRSGLVSTALHRRDLSWRMLQLPA